MDEAARVDEQRLRLGPEGLEECRAVLEKSVAANEVSQHGCGHCPWFEVKRYFRSLPRPPPPSVLSHDWVRCFSSFILLCTMFRGPALFDVLRGAVVLHAYRFSVSFRRELSYLKRVSPALSGGTLPEKLPTPGHLWGFIHFSLSVQFIVAYIACLVALEAGCYVCLFP